MGGVFGGSVQLLHAVLSGIQFDRRASWIGPSDMRTMAAAFGCYAWLIPSKTGDAAADAKPLVRVVREGKKYGISDAEVAQLLSYAEREETKQVWQAMGAALRDVRAPPRVSTWCIYGTDIRTEETLVYASRGDLTGGVQPSITYGDGDGTVHASSLEVCNNWAKQDPSPNRTYTVIKKRHVRHSPMMHHWGTIQDMMDINVGES